MSKLSDERITLEHPALSGTYAVERRPDGSLVLQPVGALTEAEIMADAGARHLTPEEFAAEFGELPTDDEGIAHQPSGSHAPTVYAIAHHRVHGEWP